MADLFDNPMGTDGFEFVEYAHPEPQKLRSLFEHMGFKQVATHKSKNITLHRQGDINFLINAEPDSFAQKFAAEHGPCVCAMAFRVKDAQKALQRAREQNVTIPENPVGEGELEIPVIEGIGGSRLYLVDTYQDETIYDTDFNFDNGGQEQVKGNGLTYIDHLTHNVFRGNMDKWAGFYEELFNFREIRYFDIEGKMTGLLSRAMTSPCGKIRIPINESRDDKSQIEEYLQRYKGEGIQHIALGTDDIYTTVIDITQDGVEFQATPDT
ncbi:MAG: 4-hydroxyphenylpyruvate dioxygenase family protein, partial [Pseudomonadota bacterium]